MNGLASRLLNEEPKPTCVPVISRKSCRTPDRMRVQMGVIGPYGGVFKPNRARLWVSKPRRGGSRIDWRVARCAYRPGINPGGRFGILSAKQSLVPRGVAKTERITT
jgi:hypothetical protein